MRECYLPSLSPAISKACSKWSAVYDSARVTCNPSVKGWNFPMSEAKCRSVLPWVETPQYRTSSHRATKPPRVCMKAEGNKSDNGAIVPSLPVIAMANPLVGCAGKPQADTAKAFLHWPASPEGLLLSKRPWSDTMTVVTTLSQKTERGVQASHLLWLIHLQRIQSHRCGSAFWLLVQPFAYHTRKPAEIGQESAVP